MKTNRVLTIAALCGGFLLMPGAMRAGDAKPAAPKNAAQSAPAVPKEAAAIAPGTYSYTDKDGKKWIFRQTPFGVAKFEDKERPASEVEAEQKRIEQTRAYDAGDSVRFERPGPFGMYRWTQKKTELNTMEQAVWERAQQRQPAGRDKE
jgi:hypothetical protein